MDLSFLRENIRYLWGNVGGLCPSAQTHPQGVWEWSTQEPQEPPVCSARLKHTKFNFIFQRFLWKVETDGPDKGTVIMCLTLTRGKKPKQPFPHWCLPLLLKDVPALQHLFKKLNKPMDISWLLAWQGIPEGRPCRRVRDCCGIRNGRRRWFLSLKENLCLKQEKEAQVTDYESEKKSG